jgi:hypothetical protein
MIDFNPQPVMPRDVEEDEIQSTSSLEFCYSSSSPGCASRLSQCWHEGKYDEGMQTQTQMFYTCPGNTILTCHRTFKIVLVDSAG